MSFPGSPPPKLSTPCLGPRIFATTHWSVVVLARDGNESQAREALEQLCQAYWDPIYAHLRRKGHSPEDAQDLAQGFFAHLLGRDFLRGLSQERGRFRAFLLAALRNFLHDHHDKARARKRGGGHPLTSWDAASAETRYRSEPLDHLSAEQVYDRRWAIALLHQAMDRLRGEFEAAGRSTLFESLRRFHSDDPPPDTGAQAAAALGVPENTFKSHLRRFRLRYRELLCEEVARTVPTPSDIADELRHLKSVLSRS